MAETKLEVLLTLTDELSDNLKKSLDSVSKNIKKTGDDLTKLGRQISQVGRNMTFLGTAITGSMAIAFKTASNYSIEVNDSLKKLTDSAIRFQEVIATAMIPVVDRISSSINQLTRWFENLNPKLRDMIIQGTLITGVLLILVGAITTIIGRLVLFVGQLLRFAAANIPLLVMAGALIALIMYWDKLRETAIPVLNAIQIGVDMVAIGFQKMLGFISNVMAELLEKFSAILELLARVSGPQQKFLQDLAENARNAADEFKNLSQATQNTVIELENNMANILTTGKSELATFVDESIIKINEFWAALAGPQAAEQFNTFINEARNVWTQFASEVNAVGKNIATIFVDSFKMITSGFGKAVADMIVYGKNFGISMKEVFQSWAAMAIQKIIEVLTQWVIMHTIGRALEAAMVAFIGVTSATIGAMWATPAALASLATLGSNAGPAAAAISSVTALAQGLAAIPKLAEGGIVSRPTIAMVGERGPEAIIPLGRRGGYGDSNISITMQNVSFRSEDDIEDVMIRLSNLITAKTRSRI